MRIKKNIILYLFPLTILLFASCNEKLRSTNCGKKDTLNYITTDYGCTFVEIFKSDSITKSPNLLIILHGDSPFNPPSYQYKLSQILSEQIENTIIAAILRPGYKDGYGHESDGVRGLTTGDNYTKNVINNLSEVIAKLKVRYKPTKTIIAGHSGGAAISANISSLKPNLVDKSILVSCPCDLVEFRKHMAAKQPSIKAWKDSVKSISPILITKKLNENANIILIHGKEDDIVPFRIAEKYYKKLKSNNIKTKLITIERVGHEIFLTDTILAILKNNL